MTKQPNSTAAVAQVRGTPISLTRLEPYLLLAGRLLLASIFIVSGIRKVFEFEAFIGYMEAFFVPIPRLLLPLAAVFEVVAGAMLALGIRTRLAAALLFAETLLLNSIFHNFWNYPPAQQQAQLNLFLFHMTTLGGFLYVFVHGGGPLSIDGADRAAGGGR